MSNEKDNYEGIEYLAMHIPTKEVVKRNCPIPEYLSDRDRRLYFAEKLAEWNRVSPGIWQYYTA
jgi:hypothetical protein